MRPVLFLDIDGVLKRPGGESPWDNYSCQLVREFADEIDALICITSTWRLTHPLAFFQQAISQRVLACTESDEESCRRDRNQRDSLVRAFLASRYDAPPPHVIVDDDRHAFANTEQVVFIEPGCTLRPSDLVKAHQVLQAQIRG